MDHAICAHSASSLTGCAVAACAGMAETPQRSDDRFVAANRLVRITAETPLTAVAWF